MKFAVGDIVVNIKPTAAADLPTFWLFKVRWADEGEYCLWSFYTKKTYTRPQKEIEDLKKGFELNY